MSMNQEWAPTARTGEPLEDLSLDEWVGQALGAASSCWIGGTGALEFDSTRCAEINKALMRHLNAVMDGVIAGTTKAVTPR